MDQEFVRGLRQKPVPSPEHGSGHERILQKTHRLRVGPVQVIDPNRGVNEYLHRKIICRYASCTA